MKIKSNCPTRAEQIAVAALLFMKTVLALPFYEKLIGIGEYASFSFSANELLAAIGALIISALFSILLVKASENLGSKMLMILLVAEPIFVTSLSSIFHILAAIITVVWMAVCFKASNKIVATAVSVIAAALISFLMPCAIFSYVFLGIAVTLIMLWDKKAIAVIGSAASTAVSVAIVSAIDDSARIAMKIAGPFSVYGGNECHALSVDRIVNDTAFGGMVSSLSKAAVASIPVIAVVIFVIVKVLKYKADYSEKKVSVAEKGFAVALLIVPYVLSAFASAICVGTGGIMGFNLVPLAILLAFALKGNRYVVTALESLGAFVKNHPVLTVIAVVWLASFTSEFAHSSRIFSSAIQFTV